MSVIDESYSINKPYFQNHSYIEWLISFTIDETMTDITRPKYKKLLMHLWQMEWEGNHVNLGNDRDRENDGFELRYRYDDILYSGNAPVHDVILIFGKVRVLEVLIALSMHMYDLMLDTDIYNSVSRWFWEIMVNVGLECLDDDYFDSMNGHKIVDETVMDILQRNRNGETRGWFSVDNWYKMEVWYQLNEYISAYF